MQPDKKRAGSKVQKAAGYPQRGIGDGGLSCVSIERVLMCADHWGDLHIVTSLSAIALDHIGKIVGTCGRD